MKNKRGVSTVVIEVLLILITIAAVMLVASFVVPFVREKLQQSTQCLDVKDSLQFQESITYKGQEYNFNCENNGVYGFSVKNNGGMRNKSLSLGGVVVTLSDGKNIKKLVIRDGDGAGEIKLLNSTSTTLIYPKAGDIQTYVYRNANANYTLMEVYPLLENEATCEKTDSIEITKCADNVLPYLI
jgi:FlaG/FlaF family flagellin (archaellin)